MATASLLGMSGGGVMDAFAIAFRIPNLFRRLFGEGALAASYLPVFAERLEKDRQSAWQLASVMLSWVTVVLVLIVMLAEAACGLIWLAWGHLPGLGLLLGLAAVMMPYLLFICLAAQVAATLHALSRFAAPALAPTLLNICWLVAAWLVAPHFAPDKHAQAYVLAVSVLVAGLLQLAVQLPVLRAAGFRFDYNWAASREAVMRIVAAMGPMLLGLAVTQINTLTDSLIAWGLSAAPDAAPQIGWLGDAVNYPMRQGAAAAIYFGERLYQFPVGVLGLAVATAIFPLLSRHAARGKHEQLGADLTLGLRLVILLGVPAGVGLIILAHPLAQLLFERGQFTATDTLRTARMIACYAGGVWAYCALPVVVRGYYALGDRVTPVRIGMWIIGLNLTLNLILIWPLAEAGLAVATAVAASVQVIVLTAAFSRRKSRLGWRLLAGTVARTVVATLLMAAVCHATLRLLAPADTLGSQLVRVLVPLLVGLVAYFSVYRLLGGREFAMLIGTTSRED